MKENTKKELYSWAKSILFAAVITFICRQFIFTPVTVLGQSMEPTFEENNKVVVSKISKIEHFDMIVFHSPFTDDEYLIKRVIGLPGDSLEVKNDVLYINGKKYSEPYLQSNKEAILPEEKLTEDFKAKVPKNSLFVMGDNRLKSGDSRRFGFISKDSIIGEVKMRIFPLEEIGIPK
ncbi:signal peptidase I [Bacillus sp. CGMCC 1.16607]|uniref:signal peptidase I n=1 Tax=Bacillus sp. CGMCC 1.16607 TaxID=3351842 RepID=UPI0036306CB5